ncbi:helix-turn-helix domain-containing protein [Kutzneria buriramensis]|uniref:Helix-turn-helix protein n=1 Tax=Kutzneria buriramensis TaxID=1045776 RepID=A0A3E0GZW6_9PSEU|nr:helix-turn-helix domain-containing protein [Kutzneria buriramensis]REH36157.1 helix-turn-helix protein [Kutzneria buriramensis]
MDEIRLDARTLRALAHPLRIRLLGLLRGEGPATATGLAQRVGETSGTTSWHLRQLAEHGFIEEDAERGNKRERWWKASYESTELRMEDFRGDTESAGALAAYLYEIASGAYRRMTTFLADDWSDAWRESFVMSDQDLPLTPAELKAMRTELHDVVNKYRRAERTGDETVIVQIQGFPWKRP